MGPFLIPIARIVFPLFLSSLLTAFVVQDEFILLPGLCMLLPTGASPTPATVRSAKITAVLYWTPSQLGFKRGGGKYTFFKMCDF